MRHAAKKKKKNPWGQSPKDGGRGEDGKEGRKGGGNETQPERAKLRENWVEESERGRRDDVRR